MPGCQNSLRLQPDLHANPAVKQKWRAQGRLEHKCVRFGPAPNHRSTLVLQQPAPTQGNWGWSQEQLLSSLRLLRLLNEWSDNNPGGTSSLLARALAIISPLHIPAAFSRDLTAWGYWLRSHSLVGQVLVNLFFFFSLHLNTDKKTEAEI